MRQFRYSAVKKWFIFLLVSTLCLDVWSQTKLKSQCEFGFKLGLGAHTVTSSRVNARSTIAVMGGFWFQIKMGKSWAMQSELTYIEKGAGRYNSEKSKNGDYWLSLYYIEVPVLFQYSKKRGYFEFGPSIAALTHAGEVAIGGLPYETELYPFSNKDFSFQLGAGYALNEKWILGFRLSHSLLPIRKQLPETSKPGYNRGIVLSVSRQLWPKPPKTKRSEVVE